ncbi:hypothetical protein VN1172_06380 [Helicobacter pylori]|nr:hypothetical protein [Helicobacter pylori]GHP83232.1 hypothetical protein VN1200_12910 [Helicobacter pylori]GHQ61168.1 hypothetical protein VN1229_04410 [Helicobacter pylori]GHS58180.1 hypothetical protein VN1172_06380 [Helicobacter pylori]
MRQEHETAKSFNELKAITQSIMLKKGALTNATHQESDRTQEANNANAKAHTQERTQTSENANISDLTQKTTLKPKSSAHAKKGALNPTKKAFSERQITAFRDNSQASANLSRGTKASHNANAFKTEQANNSSLRSDPSAKALKQGLKNTRKQRGQQ